MRRGFPSVLIIGDGLLGKELVKQTNWDYLSRKSHGFHLDELAQWEDVFSKYDVVINCIAHTKTYDSNKDEHWKVNYQFVDELVSVCNKHNVKLVHISTDYIYANSIIDASESDVPVHLGTWYGYTKLLGDAHVQLKSADFLIIRCSHKPYPFPYDVAWEDQYTNGDYVSTIAKLIIRLIEKRANGVVNVGTDTKTWYDLTKQEFRTQPIKRPIYAPENLTMDLTKLKNLI